MYHLYEDRMAYYHLEMKNNLLVGWMRSDKFAHPVRVGGQLAGRALRQQLPVVAERENIITVI